MLLGMELNWTSEVIMDMIAIIPMFVANLLLLSVYKKHKNTFMFYYMVIWGSYILFWFFQFLTYLFLSEDLFKISEFFLIIAFTFIAFAFDYMNEERLQPFTNIVITSLNMVNLYILITTPIAEALISPNGDKSLSIIGDFRVSIAIAGLISSYILLRNSFKMWRKSPDSVKYWSLVNLIGVFIFTIVPLVLFMLEITLKIPGINSIPFGLGVLISSFAIYKSPKMIYVLPFKAIKLSVIQDDTALTIYSHDWNETAKYVHEGMYSSIFEGIRGYSSEILQVGKLKEIKLDEGKILIEHGNIHGIYFTLFAKKSSKTLLNGLKKFAERFGETYGQEIRMNKQLDTLSINSEKADEMVQEIFSFIP